MKKGLLYITGFLMINTPMVFSQNPGDTLFNSPHIHDINIILTQANFWDSLMHYKQHADSFNLSTQTMKADIIVDGTQINSVGVRHDT